MEKVLQSIIVLTGLSVVSSHVQRNYFFVYEPKTFSEAQTYCREKYTDLVSVENEEEMSLLNSMVDSSKTISAENKDQAWIGLTYDVDSWRWSLSDSSFYKKGATEFRRWNTGEPNGLNEPLCAHLIVNRFWNDATCHQQYPAICCDVTGPNVTFVYVNTSMTWTDAQSYCRQHHTDLASARNMAEQNKLAQAVPTEVYYIWIGLHRDLWKWLDRSQSSFRYWKGNTKNSNTNRCVAADFKDSGKWENFNCDSKRASICYSDFSGSKVVKLRLVTSNPSLDLNNPAVMEDMLKQLEQKLKDQGLNEDLRLSWRKQADGKVFHREEEGDNKKEC